MTGQPITRRIGGDSFCMISEYLSVSEFAWYQHDRALL
ncbi:hypothetical protein NIES2104_35390 [Leptolyngbya sp. NIES-2104]|nr:hypothetical protein NIES2104_35390 [Leptolyngbya sp. NIES-2104]